MDKHKVFEIALGKIEPWYIQSIEIRKSENGEEALHVELDFPRGSEFKDEYGVLCKAWDTYRHTWQHLNFFEYRCFIHAWVPRIKDSKGNIRKVKVPWAEQNQGFTLKLEEHIMELIKHEMNISSVAKVIKVYPQRIWHVFNRRVTKAIDTTPLEDVTAIGIDETSKRKGHDYITVGANLSTGKVFKVVAGKDSGTVAQLADHLTKKGCNPQNVKEVCIDMSPAFIKGVTQSFEKAQISFDRFHVVQEVNKAMDTLRKQERAECALLKGQKYTFLKNPNKLSEKKRAELQELIQLYPKIGEGYRLKTLFKEAWSFTNNEQAVVFLQDWCTQALNSGIFPFQNAVKTIKAHWSGIIRAIQTQITNGVMEGINSKIQLAKKRARGYRNLDNFINMIYFLCGDLKISYPQAFT